MRTPYYGGRVPDDDDDDDEDDDAQHRMPPLEGLGGRRFVYEQSTVVKARRRVRGGRGHGWSVAGGGGGRYGYSRCGYEKGGYDRACVRDSMMTGRERERLSRRNLLCADDLLVLNALFRCPHCRRFVPTVEDGSCGFEGWEKEGTAVAPTTQCLRRSRRLCRQARKKPSSSLSLADVNDNGKDDDEAAVASGAGSAPHCHVGGMMG